MQKETLAVATALRGSGILISALSGGWLSVAVGSCTLAMIRYPTFRAKQGDRDRVLDRTVL